MEEDGRRLVSMDFYDFITSFCKTKMLVVESFSSKDDSTIVNLFFSVVEDIFEFKQDWQSRQKK